MSAILPPNHREVVDRVFDALNIEPGRGKTLDAILRGATLNGHPLSPDSKRKLRKRFKEFGIVTPRPTRPSYKDFIQWIADNDDSVDIDNGVVTVSMSMIVHLYDKTENQVVADVRAARDDAE